MRKIFPLKIKLCKRPSTDGTSGCQFCNIYIVFLIYLLCYVFLYLYWIASHYCERFKSLFQTLIPKLHIQLLTLVYNIYLYMKGTYKNKICPQTLNKKRQT